MFSVVLYPCHLPLHGLICQTAKSLHGTTCLDDTYLICPKNRTSRRWLFSGGEKFLLITRFAKYYGVRFIPIPLTFTEIYLGMVVGGSFLKDDFCVPEAQNCYARRRPLGHIHVYSEKRRCSVANFIVVCVGVKYWRIFDI